MPKGSAELARAAATHHSSEEAAKKLRTMLAQRGVEARLPMFRDHGEEALAPRTKPGHQLPVREI